MTPFFGKKKKWAPDANRKMTEIDKDRIVRICEITALLILLLVLIITVIIILLFING